MGSSSAASKSAVATASSEAAGDRFFGDVTMLSRLTLRSEGICSLPQREAASSALPAQAGGFFLRPLPTRCSRAAATRGTLVDATARRGVAVEVTVAWGSDSVHGGPRGEASGALADDPLRLRAPGTAATSGPQRREVGRRPRTGGRVLGLTLTALAAR